MRFGVTSKGIYTADGVDLAASVMPPVPDMEQHSKLAHTLIALTHPMLLAICFMHCKNVTQERVEGRLTRQQRRHNPRQRPPLTHHVLRIDPMRTVLASEGQSGTVGTKKAIHICRGHFAHYTDEKPLFGRVTGMIWRPDHVRGRAKGRQVTKEYEVHAPKEKHGSA